MGPAISIHGRERPVLLRSSGLWSEGAQLNSAPLRSWWSKAEDTALELGSEQGGPVHSS